MGFGCREGKEFCKGLSLPEIIRDLL
ncbi:TPA: phosphatase, partial [Neisseria meningitidis]